MFIDETTFIVQAGDGGNGCYAHERLKYIPKGRPSGGNGGRGGSVYVICSPNVHTLQDVSYRKTCKAQRGAHGKGSNREGKSGNDIVLEVPCGTLIREEASGRILADCTEPGRRYLLACGGAGGKGNAALVSRKNPDPQQCQPGKPGEKRHLHLSLKLLADVGLVGRPNAGKSTFLSCISKARPRIADYPFTTTEPHLGIVSFPQTHDSLVVADIPGLVADSHKGKGMGIRFLKHIERTEVLAILISATEEDPAARLNELRGELAQYSPALAEKPFCCIRTKGDLVDPQTPVPLPHGWLSISSVTGEGIAPALAHLRVLVKAGRTRNDAAGE